ncbi:uncharacterized protein JCM15063_005055 [Sporobolomyces koalae]|uniref:uncharacterized protein n=1 Tax=Sporobolomyces koalae TaxID=500713 RepID=UPI00317A9466
MASTARDVPVLTTQPPLHPSSPDSLAEKDLPTTDSEKSSLYDSSSVAPLAPAVTEPSSAGDAILRYIGLRKRRAYDDLDAVATKESVYDGPLASHYQPHPKWENKEFFDPAHRWTHREERKLVRKIDWKILSWVLVMFLALDIDRGNMANATADNLLGDLKLTQADYNLGNTLSKLGFLLAELPSQMVGKKLGVDRWVPMQIVIFSILAGSQFFMQGRASFLALRFAIAFFQGGFIPDCILYLSYFFTNSELPLRLSLFWSINYIADTITSFLAVGLLRMRGVLGYEGWRWMFLIEALLTLAIGVASFFMLPPSPSQTKSKLFPKGYFTDREIKILVNRIVREDPGKATMHNRQALTPRLLWKSLKDYDMYPMYVIGLMFGIPAYPIGNYFQISMRQLGFSTVMANLLAVPHTVISVILLIVVTALSEVVQSRTWLSILENVWFLPFFIALRTLPVLGGWQYFALATLLLGFPYVHAIQVSWASRNSGSVRTRTVSASVYNMAVQLSGIIGSNLYQKSDAPRYFKANSIILGIIAFNIIIVYPGTWFYYRARNAWKDKQWSNMSTQQKSEYLATTKDEGCRRLDFKFVY